MGLEKHTENRLDFCPVCERDEDGIVIATVPEVPGVVGQGETWPGALHELVRALAFTVWAIEDEE